MKLRFISPTVHGIIDYLTAATLPVFARAMGWDDTITHLHDGVAGGIAALAATTDFAPGMVKVVPLKAHLTIDAVTGVGLLAAAALMDDEDNLARFCTGCVGAFLLSQAAFTTTQSGPDRVVDRAGRGSPMARFAEERRPEAAYSYGAAGV